MRWMLWILNRTNPKNQEDLQRPMNHKTWCGLESTKASCYLQWKLDDLSATHLTPWNPIKLLAHFLVLNFLKMRDFFPQFHSLTFKALPCNKVAKLGLVDLVWIKALESQIALASCIKLSTSCTINCSHGVAPNFCDSRQNFWNTRHFGQISCSRDKMFTRN